MNDFSQYTSYDIRLIPLLYEEPSPDQSSLSFSACSQVVGGCFEKVEKTIQNSQKTASKQIGLPDVKVSS